MIVKKVLALLMVVVLCMTMLAACGVQRVLFCSEEKKGKTIDFFGEKVHICNDCEKDIKSAFE